MAEEAAKVAAVDLKVVEEVAVLPQPPKPDAEVVTRAQAAEMPIEEFKIFSERLARGEVTLAE
jgi:hypothetical protein